MDEKHKKNKNSIQKSVKYILAQAKAGSPVHIGIIAGAVLLTIILAVFAVKAFSNSGNESRDDFQNIEIDKEYNKDLDALDTNELVATILPETEKVTKEYIDNTLFIGDSNTVRTMLYGYTTWDNVVAAVSMGVQHITELKMTYFKGMKDPVTVPEAVKIIQPQRIIITYGTNNLTSYTPEEFVKEYKKGLDAISKAYPYATIIINSIPPLDRQRENPSITMQHVDSFNKALAEFAKEEGYKFLNSSEALKDEKTGFAKTDYTIGDGVHLSMKGMDALFDYIMTHAYETEDTRPKPLKKVPEREETPTGIISEDPIAVRGTRIKLIFQSSDSDLGKVTGEVEQKIKRSVRSSDVTAIAKTENGGIFTGWSCSYSGISNRDDETIRYTVPQVDENVREIYIIANFKKVELKLSDKKLTLEEGDSHKLATELSHNFKGNTEIVWNSDKKSVATVDSKGVVTAVSEGEAKITASMLDGKVTATCTVTVKTADSAQVSPSPSPSPEIIPSPSPEIIPSPSPEIIPSPSPEIIPSPSPKPTVDVSPSPTPIPDPSPEQTVIPTSVPSPSPDPTPTTSSDEKQEEIEIEAEGE